MMHPEATVPGPFGTWRLAPVDAHKAAVSDSSRLDDHPDQVEKARLAASAHSRDHLDEVGVTKEHRLLEAPVAVLEPATLQELLQKLGYHFTFGSIKPPRHRRPKI